MAVRHTRSDSIGTGFFQRLLFTDEHLLLFKMINKSNSHTELTFFDHQSTVIRPVNILLTIGQTILIGGIARIDVKHVCPPVR